MPVKVSVVVPVYNAAASLTRCLESLRTQTLDDMEFLLVDDGSTDSSGEICDRAADADGRFHVLHIENGGPANARNVGMAAAAGEYIGFADADDWMEPEMYARLYGQAAAQDADIAVCDYWSERGDTARCLSVLPGEETLYGRDAVLTRILPYFFGYADDELHDYKRCCPLADTRSYVWIGLYRTRMIRAHDLRFPSEKLYYTEDNLFNLLAANRCGRLCYLPQPLYHHTEAAGSFTGRFTEKYFDMRLHKYEYLRNFIKENELDIVFCHRLENKVCAESISVIDYYVAAGGLSLRQKLAHIRRIAESDAVSHALAQAKLDLLPFSPQRIFLSLLRARRAGILLGLASAYVGAVKTRSRRECQKAK